MSYLDVAVSALAEYQTRSGSAPAKEAKKAQKGSPADVRPLPVSPRLAPRDLRYPLDYVREQIATVPDPWRAFYDFWLWIALQGEWWDRETAERAVFGLMVDHMADEKPKAL